MDATTSLFGAPSRPPLPYQFHPLPAPLELRLRRLERLALGAQGLCWRFDENASQNTARGPQ